MDSKEYMQTTDGDQYGQKGLSVISAKRERTVLEPADWYTTEEVAAMLRVDASSLRRWRTARPPQGPPFVTISDRTTRYSGADLIAYLKGRRVDPTAAA
ncbi:helix-turn-helix domain-containing protein [Nocardia spumae]|uniref:helix-turn-helix domain-containing protein n=1 Tax=Nocardia spumae TaxID=2887190 RepID=UPI001D1584DC|nr:helix-turn-helix domain-containing protein [Nocardia spumae]